MKSKRSIIFNIVSIILILVCLFSFITFSYYLLKLNIIPIKYLLFGYILFALSLLFLVLTIMGKRNRILKSLVLFIVGIISFAFFFATFYLNNTYKFLNNMQPDYDTLTYSVLVLNNSFYDEINSLHLKTISYLDNEYKEDIQKELSSRITYHELLTTEFGVLSDRLLNGEVDAICLEESYLILIREEIENFEESTKVISTFKVRGKVHKEEENKINVSKQPFVVYISGIDQYGNVTSVRGRSDVNQIAVINPKTNHILLVNTPRDYYVQLAGTTGLKDKLTHAGIYGIDKSIATLENLYEIDINHYVRVNFNTLIKVVDVIGGIDIESDSSFTCWTNRKVHVEKGWNHFNGEQALAYSRERYAYLTGDHHRGANQQQVITAIINKVGSSKVLISKYNSILNTLNGSFQTDMSMDMITSFIRYQLDKMPSWNIESIAVTGSNSENYTYSMGTGYKLYVMEPDYNSIATAKQRINEVLNEQ